MCEKNEWIGVGEIRERQRIIKLFQDMIDENIQSKSDGMPGWAIWAKTVIEDSVAESSASEK